MSDVAGIEVGRVERWVGERVEGMDAPFAFERIKGGHSNLTYRVTAGSGRVVVLRRPPLGPLLPTAHDMSREYRLIAALGPAGVPAPPALAFCDDTDVTGAPFYVMGFVEGAVLHDRAAAEAAFTEAQRGTLGMDFIDVLAGLHDIDPDAVGLGGLGRKEGYIARQLKRWYSQYEQQRSHEVPRIDEVHDRLAARIPEQGPARVVHGDYRLGNCISVLPGRIAAVLDWEIATLGDPLADLGYVMATWSYPGDANPNVLSPTMSPGFPGRDALVARYAERSGRDCSLVGYYTAFSQWKGACITMGVYSRYLQGSLDTTGVDLEGFRLSIDRSAEVAAASLARMGA